MHLGRTIHAISSQARLEGLHHPCMVLAHLNAHQCCFVANFKHFGGSTQAISGQIGLKRLGHLLTLCGEAAQ